MKNQKKQGNLKVLWVALIAIVIVAMLLLYRGISKDESTVKGTREASRALTKFAVEIEGEYTLLSMTLSPPLDSYPLESISQRGGITVHVEETPIIYAGFNLSPDTLKQREILGKDLAIGWLMIIFYPTGRGEVIAEVTNLNPLTLRVLDAPVEIR